MKKNLLIAVAVSLLAFSAFADQHLVLFRTAGAPADFASQVTALGGMIVSQHEVLAVVSGLTDAGAATLKGVADVQPDSEVSIDVPEIAGAEQVYSDAVESQTNPTLAGRYAWQWNMRAIGADKGWAAGRLGSANVTVAIIDTGIDYRHADLLGRVDLSRSASFQPTDDAFLAAHYPGAHPIADLYFHGTHVASTVVSNGIATAGVTSKVTLIGVKVLSRKGSGDLSAVLNGVLWAADHGADVGNMSLGSWWTKDHSGRYVGLINRVFEYANRKGTLMVVSAGNSAMDLDHDGNGMDAYCSAPNVVCVSATGPTSSAGRSGPWVNVDALAVYSNYGRSAIDVAAPGGNTGGSVWAACSAFSQLISCPPPGIYVVGASGTSMAAPHVSGLAALIVEDVGHGHPALVKARLEQSADDLGQPGTDPAYGKGRINVPRADGLQ